MTPDSERRAPPPFGWSREKLSVWLVFGALVYALQPVFTILFMTYIMSYVANLAVTFLTGRAGEARPAFRKLVIFILYLATFGLGFLAAQSILPKAIAQGKALLEQLPELNVDRMRDELLARTIGKLELASYSRTPQYEKDLAEFVSATRKIGSFAEARALERQVREAFERDLLEREAVRELEELKRGTELGELYKQWLKDNRAARELDGDAQLRKKLSDEYDASFAVVNGDAALGRERQTPAYEERRHAANLERVTALLASAGRDRSVAEHDLAAARAAEKVRSLPAAERDARFKAFFQEEAPRRFPSLALSYEKFVELASIRSEDEFRQRFREESPSRSELEEKFKAWMELKLTRDSRLAGLFGDASQMAREGLPRITGWITSVINHILAFGFDALVSLMFSFLIVWELPHFAAVVERLKGTQAERFYDELAPEVQRLGIVIGTAFSAQFLIAVIDAALVFLALTWLGLSSAVFLALIVLTACLIPYVGLIIAAPPILFVALQSGVGPAGRVALALVLIHELDAWILSPTILGEFLRLHPLAVIAVLFIAQPIFGMWGLFLGVPVAVFLINDVLLRPVAAPVDGE